MDALFIEEVLDHLHYFEQVVLDVVQQFGIFDPQFLLQEDVDHGIGDVVTDIARV